MSLVALPFSHKNFKLFVIFLKKNQICLKTVPRWHWYLAKKTTELCNPHFWLLIRCFALRSITINSGYIGQNKAIWLADEVLRYRDHHTLRCQDNISWHLISNNPKDVTLIMVCILLWETASQLTCIFELKQYKCHSMFSNISTNYKLQR